MRPPTMQSSAGAMHPKKDNACDEWVSGEAKIHFVGGAPLRTMRPLDHWTMQSSNVIESSGKTEMKLLGESGENVPRPRLLACYKPCV